MVSECVYINPVEDVSKAAILVIAVGGIGVVGMGIASADRSIQRGVQIWYRFILFVFILISFPPTSHLDFHRT